MMQISSNAIWFYKRVFPAVWFGLLAVMAIGAGLSASGLPDLFYVVAPLLIASFGFVTMKRQIWTLVDAVWDGGDYLIVKSRGEEDRIPLGNIINVGASTAPNSYQVTLRLADPGKFGSEITFVPLGRSRLRPFVKNAVIEDLIIRVDQARSSRHPRK